MLKPEEYDMLPVDPDEALLAFLDIAIPRARNAEWEASQEQNGDGFLPWESLFAALSGILESLGRDNDLSAPPPSAAHGDWTIWRSGLRGQVEKLHASLSFKLRRGGGSGSDLTPVALTPAFRDEIRGHTRKIRKILNKIDVSENLRHLLLNRLNRFEQDLDRTRTRYEALFSFILDASEAVGEGATNLKPAVDQAERVAAIMRKSGKVAQIETEERKALPAPESLAQDQLGDEIPF